MRGFSLVELAIVLVILGLLTGGILAGQSLIRAAELRSVVADYQRFTSAAQTFRDKYMAIPGDMNNATRFWLRQVSATHCVTNSSAAVGTPGTCDGNGDGALANNAPSQSQSGEAFQFWRQLAHAGMIEGSYTGLAGPSAGGGGSDAIIGINVPSSKLSNAGWAARSLGNYSGDTFQYAYNYGSNLAFGLQMAGWPPLGSALRPEEAWNIDMKLDDGMPGRGRILARGLYGGGASSCTTSADYNDLTGQYTLTNTSQACAINFANAF